MKKFDWKRFWLSVMAVAVLSFVFFDLATTARAEEFVITGYALGEFAVKGEVEKQAQALVKKIEKDKPIIILVEGSADKSGNAAENDSVARKRAEEMKAFLEIRFTSARIIARSKGDQDNLRRVRIEYSIIPISASAPAPVAVAKKSMSEQALYLFSLSFGIAVVAVVSFVLVGLILRRNRTTKEKKQAPALEPFPETHLSDEPLAITVNGREYDFFSEVTDDGRFKTLHQLGKGKFLFVSDRKELKRSLRSTFKNFPDLAPSLLKQGRLRIKS